MNRKEYNKHKTKLKKILTEFVEVFKEVGNIEIEYTWHLDECNSITYKGILYTFWEDHDELYDESNLVFNFSEAIREIIDIYSITRLDVYCDTVVEGILKNYKDELKKAKRVITKFEKAVGDYSNYIIDNLEEGVIDVDKLLDLVLDDIEVEDEILYSYDKETWVEYSDVAEFIECEGLVDGTEFYIKTNGKIKKHTAFVEEVVEYQINFR